MSCLLHICRIVLLLLSTCLLSIEVTSVQEGSSYFFYHQPEYPRDCKEVLDQCPSNNLGRVFTIKPDGYTQPFEVYCNNDISSGGWTVIQRQIDGSLTFQRSWEDYKNGFGFLSSEFWIGNDKLSFLSNQAVYELRIDITLSNGSSFYVKYNSFRISDEWGSYAIVSVGEFRSNWSCVVSTCPLTMNRDTCTCQDVCSDPIGRMDCHTECVESCVPEGCFVAEKNSFITNGESFITAGCTQNCTCIGNQLSCNADYECSTDATCTVKDGIRKCYCNQGYEGDGETCIRNSFRDCYDVYQSGQTTDGIYTILPTGWQGSPFEVFCNMTFGDGGWTVFQRRIDGMADFYRNWTEYQEGFGILNQGNDFWLGNEQLRYLTDQRDYILHIDFVDSSDGQFYEEYNTFKISDGSDKYRLSYGSFNDGNTGHSDGYLSNNNGEQFSTFDQDNDGCNNHNLAERHRGGWWYWNANCRQCFSAGACYDFAYGSSGCYTIGSFTNLNGDYNGGNGENIFYLNSNGPDCNHKFAEMKIRPLNT